MAFVRSGGQSPTGDAVAGDVKAGKIFSNENDVDLVGTFAAQEKTVTAGTSAASVTPDSGKYLSKVTYNPTPTQEKTANPSGTSQAITPDSNYHLSKVTVNGVSIAVALKTSSFQNKPITVKNSSNVTVATTTFDSSGNAMVILTAAGTYTFTVTY